MIAIGFLVYFNHHIALSLQASTIIAAVREETLRTVDGLTRMDEKTDETTASSVAVEGIVPGESAQLTATSNGYVASVVFIV